VYTDSYAEGWRTPFATPIHAFVTGRAHWLSRLLLSLTLATATAACAAQGAPTMPGALPFPPTMSPASLRPAAAMVTAGAVSSAAILQTALGFRGVPYRYGGEDPRTGFDCSGFIRFVMAQHQLTLPRTTAEQFQIGRRVAPKDIQAGDLVFFSTVAPGASHVGLAIGPDEFVHAPATSGVVRVERLEWSYWQSRFVGARRLISE
jgi:cell wall-associated NlpC family hydrolase